MPEKTEENITRVYSALGNPYRRQIVDILKERGKAGFKELHDTLKISVGAVYHHLETLEGLVDQGPDKKYILTDRGRSAIETLSVSEEKIATARAYGSLGETRLRFLSKEILLGRAVFNYLNREPIRSLPLAVIIVLFGGWVSSQTNLEPLLLFYLNPSPGLSRAWFLLLFPLGWLATFAITDILTIAIFKRKGGDISLLNGTEFAMLPLLVVPGIFFFAQSLATTVRTENLLIVLLPIALQVWVVCLLSSAISFSKGLKMERSAVVSLAVIYLNILALVATLQLGIF
jgi:DNA-binding transcriptional ArsR family regulator